MRSLFKHIILCLSVLVLSAQAMVVEVDMNDPVERARVAASEFTVCLNNYRIAIATQHRDDWRYILSGMRLTHKPIEGYQAESERCETNARKLLESSYDLCDRDKRDRELCRMQVKVAWYAVTDYFAAHSISVHNAVSAFESEIAFRSNLVITILLLSSVSLVFWFRRPIFRLATKTVRRINILGKP